MPINQDALIFGNLEIKRFLLEFLALIYVVVQFIYSRPHHLQQFLRNYLVISLLIANYLMLYLGR